MTTEYLDTPGVSLHDNFQEWRTENQNGVFLTLATRSRANLHGARCRHLGSGPPYFTSEDGFGSLTTKKKICASESELLNWATKNDVAVVRCQHCVSDGFVSPGGHTIVEPNEQHFVDNVGDDDEASRTFANAVRDSLASDRESRLGRLREARSKPATRTQVIRIFDRNPDVVAEALWRSDGNCERCGCMAPFRRASDGSPYLEVHHKVRLADGSDDTAENAIALCPNCHREQHYG